MLISTDDCLSAIAAHSAGFARAAASHLDARVEHCPDWSVADLVWHMTEVHWFWSTIAGELLSEPPPRSRAPQRPADADLVATFERGAERIVEVLQAADQSAACWTWFPSQQDVAFVTRHQVQEAAVHHWDAANAAGDAWSMERSAAADSVDEFLTCSLADESDAQARDLTPLGADLAFRATDTGGAWRVSDGAVPGALVVRRDADGDASTLSAPAPELLLWLYARRSLDSAGVAPDLLDRFRALSSTD